MWAAAQSQLYKELRQMKELGKDKFSVIRRREGEGDFQITCVMT